MNKMQKINNYEVKPIGSDYAIFKGDKIVTGFWQYRKAAEKALFKMKLTGSENIYIKLWLLLEKHDWTYQYADDNRAYLSGQAEVRVMQDYTKMYPETLEMFNHYNDYRKGGSEEFHLSNYVNIKAELKYLKVEVY